MVELNEYMKELCKQIKANYLIKVLKFKGIFIDDYTIGFIKGINHIKIKYNKGLDLYDVELKKTNSLKKELETGKLYKYEKSIKGVYNDELLKIIENHFKYDIYNLL